MAVILDQIVPWGRTRREYELMFDLAPADLSAGILDCGGGPASFAAEMAADGFSVVSADPLYEFSSAQIRERFEAAYEPMLAQVRATPDDWVWNYHRNADDLGANRRQALERFLADYEQGARVRRYVIGELPSLPFDDGSFGLAFCSHLLFLYSELMSQDFHIRAVLELCRVAPEVRIFPLLTLDGKGSPHLEPVRAALASRGWSSAIVRVDYGLQRGGDEMLKIFRV